MMLFKKINLKFVPVFLIKLIKVIQFFVKIVADNPKIFSSKIIEISITNNFFQQVIWALRNLCSHDHAAYTINLFFCIITAWQCLLCNRTTYLFMIFGLYSKSRIMIQYSC